MVKKSLEETCAATSGCMFMRMASAAFTQDAVLQYDACLACFESKPKAIPRAMMVAVRIAIMPAMYGF